jgi:hypothetical protein
MTARSLLEFRIFVKTQRRSDVSLLSYHDTPQIHLRTQQHRPALAESTTTASYSLLAEHADFIRD